MNSFFKKKKPKFLTIMKPKLMLLMKWYRAINSVCGKEEGFFKLRIMAHRLSTVKGSLKF